MKIDMHCHVKEGSIDSKVGLDEYITILKKHGFQGMVISDYFGGSPYMDADEGLRAGNDMLLNTFADGTLTDKTSATSLNAVRNAAHNVLYTVVNSNAMQGIASGVKITYELAGWQKALIAGDVVMAVIIIAGAVLVVKKRKKA